MEPVVIRSANMCREGKYNIWGVVKWVPQFLHMQNPFRSASIRSREQTSNMHSSRLRSNTSELSVLRGKCRKQVCWVNFHLLHLCCSNGSAWLVEPRNFNAKWTTRDRSTKIRISLSYILPRTPWAPVTTCLPAKDDTCPLSPENLGLASKLHQLKHVSRISGQGKGAVRSLWFVPCMIPQSNQTAPVSRWALDVCLVELFQRSQQGVHVSGNYTLGKWRYVHVLL